MNDDEKRARRNARLRERWATDPAWRERRLAANGAWCHDHKDELAERRRQREANDPEYRERRHLQRVSRYGMSVDDYRALLSHQGEACAICRRPFTRTPCIDHCHITGLVRGLLCQTCNTGLGSFLDNPFIAGNAFDYLHRWYEFITELFIAEDSDMTCSDNAADDGGGSGVMRQAILEELQRPFGVDPPQPTNWLQAVSRFLVTQAAQDLNATREVLDRIDGKMPSGPVAAGALNRVNLMWNYPTSRMNPPKQLTAAAPPPAACT
jgi:hypothetical protein